MRYLPLLLVVVFFPVARAQTTNATPAAAPAGSPSAPPAASSPATASVQAMQETSRLISQQKYDEAMAKINGVIQSDPRNISAFVLRGQIYSEKKMWDQAANDFQSAHLIDPKNAIVNFDVAEIKFTQKAYDAARAGFADLSHDTSNVIGDLANYKVFLCDLMGNHMDMAQKEFDAFNNVGSGASYYYANAAWSLVHHQTEDARGWLASARNIYTPQKNNLYSRSLQDLGLLPLPPAPAMNK